MSVDADGYGDADADVDAEGIRIVLPLLRRGELKMVPKGFLLSLLDISECTH